MTQSMESNSEKETWEIGNRIAQQCEAERSYYCMEILALVKRFLPKGLRQDWAWKNR